MTDGADILNERIARFPRDQTQEMAGAMRGAAFDNGVWIESNGVKKPIPVALRPRLIDPSTQAYVFRASSHLRAALTRLRRMRAEDARIQALLPLTEIEEAWLARYPEPSPGGTEGVFCRLDAIFRFHGPDARSTLQFIEPNVVGIGGMSYAPAAEQAFLKHVAAPLAGSSGGPKLAPNPDPRELLWDELLSRARALGVAGEPTIALVDDKDSYTLGGEFGRLTSYYQSLGRDVIYVSPTELCAGRGGVTANGRRISVVYRFLELRDIAEREAAGADMRGIRAAFQAGLVVPSLAGDFEHKSTFEVFTSPELFGLFTPDERAVMRAHVPWTRLLFERRTEDPDGRVVDLLPYALNQRERLVIKPNRSEGGEGVHIGVDTSPSDWETILSRAAREPGEHVVQLASPPDIAIVPEVAPDGELVLTPKYLTAGFFAGLCGLGVFGRASSDRVVNLSRGGQIAPYLLQMP